MTMYFIVLQYMKVEQVQSVVGEVPDFGLDVLALFELERKLLDRKRELRRGQWWPALSR